nr:hypothetical protein HK105_005770 [Polyrhizophydium stewartii]
MAAWAAGSLSSAPSAGNEREEPVSRGSWQERGSRPAAAGADGAARAVVRLHAAALNHRDVFIRERQYPAVVDGSVLGADGAGVLVAAPPGTALAPGARVVINSSVGWDAAAAAPICLAMEASEKECEVKAHTLMRQYQDQFYDMTFTVHPAGIPGEARGKSSNVSWAAREMARRSSPSSRSREILTVMDADTAFAQDYFTAIAYHYAVAKPEDRRIMMFVPSTVFDRNSGDVPMVVRTADMVWSAGVIGNMHPDSPVKIPCSAYSLSLNLAIDAGFWDTDPTSIGEDMHMFLKCFYATEGRLITTPIFSPASQCDVQGDTWVKSLWDRYQQSKRHMWGSLDVGYIIRRALFALCAPGYDAPGGQLQEVPLIRSDQTRGSQDIQISVTKILHLFHRVFEANIIMGQVFMLVFITSLTLPVANSPSPFASSFWSLLSDQEVHPYVQLATGLGGYMRIFSALPSICMAIYYEKYYYWVSTERWIWSLREQVRPGSGQRVQPLGKRPQLSYTRSFVNLLDWAALPICGIYILAAPQIQAHIMQLFTDRLDYVVAAKPQVPKNHQDIAPMSAGLDSESLEAVTVDPASVPLVRLSFADAGQGASAASAAAAAAASSTARGLRPPRAGAPLSVAEEADGKSTISSRGDSGFYDFDDSNLPSSGPVSPSLFSPTMWRQHKPARSTLSSELSDGENDYDAESGIVPSASMDFALPPAASAAHH